MAELLTADLELRLLAPDDGVKKASHGEEIYFPLRVFLANDAKKHHARHVSKTYVFADAKKRVIAYITITCSQVLLDEGATPEDVKKVHFPFPAVKIAKLMVDSDIRKNGLGMKLVKLAVAVAIDKIMPNVGCRFVTVDAHRSAIDFYKACGFVMLDTDENRQSQDPLMFYDLGKV